MNRGKLERQKYAKTVSLFSALSVITSKPAKTWRVYHSDTKKKQKKKTIQWNVISIVYIVTNRVHHCTIPKSEDAVADLRFCAKGHHLTYFTPGKVMMIIRKTSHTVFRYSFSGTISMFSFVVLVRSLQNSHQWLKFVKVQFLVKSMPLWQQ